MVSSYLAWIAGARAEIFQTAPGERARFATLGGAILSTAAVAAVSATFAFRMAVRAPLPIAIALGLLWGLLILNLDRALVVGISRQNRWWMSVLAFLPRIAIAVILGAVISTPVVLQIFDSEIQAAIPTIHQQARQKFDAEQAATYAEISTLQSKIADEKKILTSGGSPTSVSQDPDVLSAQKVLNDAQAKFDAAQKAADCEASGTCGSGKAGQGPIYAAKESERRKTFAALQAAQKALADATATATTRSNTGAQTALSLAQKSLDNDTSRLELLVAQKAKDESDFLAKEGNSEGILARMEGLDFLAGQHPTVDTARKFLFLLFLSIEVLPVVLKLILTVGKATQYDLLAQIKDDASLSAASVWPEMERDAERIRTATFLEAVKDEKQRQLDVIKSANAEVAVAQAQMVGEFLKVWKAEALRASQLRLAQLATGRANAQPAPPSPASNTAPTSPTTPSSPSNPAPRSPSTPTTQPVPNWSNSGWGQPSPGITPTAPVVAAGSNSGTAPQVSAPSQSYSGNGHTPATGPSVPPVVVDITEASQPSEVAGEASNGGRHAASEAEHGEPE